MSAPVASMNADDDGPEEGEIEDDDDDIIFLEGNSTAPVPHRYPHGSSATSSEVHPIRTSPARKNSYERDIRHFELRKNRAARSSRASGSTKSPHSSHKDDTRIKPKYSRTGLTQGKENRHAHRHKSPSYRHRNGSHDRTLANCKDVSPLRKDSSCSSDESIDHEIRSSAGRSSRPHHRLTPSARLIRPKRKASSSPDSIHFPTKRKSHRSEKCPLMKVLKSVARETRLINNTMETQDSTLETSSSLRQRLLNMGVMSEVSEEQSSVNDNMKSQSSSNSIEIKESEEKIGKTLTKEDLKNPGISETLDNNEVIEVTNNENNAKSTSALKFDNAASPSKISKVEDAVSPASSASSVKILDSIENDSLIKLSESTNITSSPFSCENHDDDDDDDISQLRLLALKSKKHEPAPADDADVLELRLAALKTAFMKKFKTRKKNTARSVANPSKEDLLSPIDVSPPLFPPGCLEDAMTPVDMELAETDDEATSEHSMDCYSPSDPIHEYFPPDPNPEHLSSLHSLPEPYSPSRPTGSPTREPSLQELLPPPPPPDLDLYLSEPEPNPERSSQNFQVDQSSEGYYLDYVTSDAVLEPPPLPSYFRDLLSGISDVTIVPLEDTENDSNLREKNLVPCSSIVSETPLIHETTTIPESTCQDAPSKLQKSENVKRKEVLCESTDPDSMVALINAAEIASESISESKHEEPTENSLKPSNNLLLKAKNKPPLVPLEEEEKMLRQRLLLNMANKKNNALMNKNVTKDQPLVLKKKLVEIPPKILSSKSVGIVSDTNKKSKVDETKCYSKTSIVPQPAKSKPTSQVPSVPSLGDDNRLIINLEEDSDSCEDYSEAEALGKTCAKNREKWLLQIRELEVNVPKTLGLVGKTASVVTTKVSPRNGVKSRPPVKENNQVKPFAENLADLENSVEQFLKGVRKSHEAVSKTKHGLTAPSNATPVAVRHLPAPQQEEYRRLKQEIARLERQRQISVQQKQKTLHVSEEQKNKISPAGEHPKNKSPLLEELPKKSIPNIVGNLKRNVTLSEVQPKKSIPISYVKMKKNLSLSVVHPKRILFSSKETLKTVPNSAISSRQEMRVPSSNVASSINPPNAQKIGVQAVGISRVDKKVSALPLNQSNPVSSVEMLKSTLTTCPEGSVKKVQDNNNAATVAKTVGSVSSQKAGVKKTTNVPLQLKPAETQKAADIEPKTHISLINLEATVIRERSNVLNELSALSKLLSQVEKSIVAQSNTATEVSSLLDKLCLAAGRWKAQDKTVTGLVQRVAQRQKELSLRHQSCSNASTSCIKLGSALNEGSYRGVPVDKADAMRLQLKDVQEKTQDLAKRRIAERARKNVLEKRAEDCLYKLFNDSKKVTVGNNQKVSAQGSVSYPKVLTKEGKLETVPASVSQVNQPLLTSSKLPNDNSSLNLLVTSPEMQSSSAYIPNIPSKVNTAILARAVSHRLALNKVKSAKAVLNLAQTKHLNKKAIKGRTKRMHLNSQTDEDCKHDLSDMEISTEDEETDGRGKCLTGNTDVVDMSVSPDTSLSPLHIEKEALETDLSHSNHPDCRMQVVSAEASLKSTTDSWKLPIPLREPSLSKEGPVGSSKEKRQSSKPSAKGALKDYVSPFGGLSVFSKSEKSETKGGDLYGILCPYDLNGKCEDSECAFKHQNDSVKK